MSTRPRQIPEHVFDGMPVQRFDAYPWVIGAEHLYAGGFRYGHGIVTMLAISQVESDRGVFVLGPVRFTDDDGRPIPAAPVLRMNADGTYDRGWLMVNSSHDVWTDQAMVDPVLCARAAFALSKRGEDFGPWTQWRTGAFRKHMDVARYAVALMHLKHGYKPAPLDVALYPKGA